MTKQKQPWTAADLDRLTALVESRKLPWPEIGAELDRGWAACKVQYFYQRRLRAQGRKPEPRRSMSYTQRDEALAKAEEVRASAGQWPEPSLTAKFCGDPAPGRSALDRKRAGIVDPPPHNPSGDKRFTGYRVPVTLAGEGL